MEIKKTGDQGSLDAMPQASNTDALRPDSNKLSDGPQNYIPQYDTLGLDRPSLRSV